MRKRVAMKVITEMEITGGIICTRLIPDAFAAVISSSLDNLPKVRRTASRKDIGMAITINEGRM